MLLQSGDDSAFFDWPSSSSISSSSTVVSKSQSGESLSQPPRSVRSSRIHHATYLIRIGSSFTFPANRCFFGMLHVVARLAARWRRHLNATADNARCLRPTQTYAQKPILPKNVWHLFLRSHFLPSHRMFFFTRITKVRLELAALFDSFAEETPAKLSYGAAIELDPSVLLLGFFLPSFFLIYFARSAAGISVRYRRLHPWRRIWFRSEGFGFFKTKFLFDFVSVFFFC